MKKSEMLEITYKSYWEEDEKTLKVAPYCVKLFRQRWYMVARRIFDNKIRIYALDRIRELSVIAETFTYPDDFSPEAYFEGFYGIIHVKNVPIETVILKVGAGQANYMRALPLHPSQKELERNIFGSIFALKIRPTFDFMQEILWNGDAVEVLEPQWLRIEMAGIVKRLWDKYKLKRKC